MDKEKGKDKTCHVCGKVGHLAANCWHKDKSAGNGKGKGSSKSNPGKIHEVAHGPPKEDPGERQITSISSQELGPSGWIFAINKARGQPLREVQHEWTYALVDSGACTSVCGPNTFAV
jgi:hypothetical protein